MRFAESAGKLGGTLVAMAHTRLELAALEVEEESQRFLRQLLVSLFALFLAGVAVVLAVFLVVLVFWDSYRLQAVLVAIGVLLGAAALLGLKVRRELHNRPPLLSHTLGELRKDLDGLRAQGAGDEP